MHLCIKMDNYNGSKIVQVVLAVFIGSVLGFVFYNWVKTRIDPIDKFQEIQHVNSVPKMAKRKYIDVCQESGYLSITSSGRLGNLISQYAMLYGYSRTYNQLAVINEDMHNHLSVMFKHLSIPIYVAKSCTSPFYCEFEWAKWNSKLFNLNCNTRIVGHPMVLKHFAAYKDELLKDLTLSSCMKAQVSYFFKQNVKKYVENYVGVHVRRTDYEEALQQGRSSGGFFLSKAYYWSAMDYFRKRFKSVMFVIASDDPEWIHANLNGSDVIFTMNPNSNPNHQIELDMSILSQCNHSIISYGTYSFWSAYLRRKGTTLFVDNHYQNFYHDPRYVNSKDTKWIPWKDPCVIKKDGIWHFDDNAINCTRH